MPSDDDLDDDLWRSATTTWPKLHELLNVAPERRRAGAAACW
jgi:hypothetical protein